MKLHEVIDDLSGIEIAEFDSASVRDALSSEKPEVKLKNAFGEAFWPKIKRWLDKKLKSIKISKEEEDLIGAPLRPKLEKYLKKDSDQYEANIETLIREISNVYNEWKDEEFKDKDLPLGRFQEK